MPNFEELMKKFAEWFQQNNWIITLLISIPLSILANLLTEPFKQWMATKSFEQSKKRIQELEADLDNMVSLAQDRDKLSIENTKAILRILIYIGLGGVITSSPLYTLFTFGIIFYLMTVIEAYLHIRLLNRIGSIEKYTNETKRKISELKAQKLTPIQFRIQNATYGAGNNTKDVTEILNSKISAGKLEIRVISDNFGGDPALGTPKELRVTYIFNGHVMSKIVPENDILILP